MTPSSDAAWHRTARLRQAIAGVKGPDAATLHAFASSALEAVAVSYRRAG